MSPEKRCLIAIDLDDTILSELFSLNSRSVNALIDAQEAGHVVMIATARPRSMAMPYYRALGLRSPLSTLNGAYLYHPDDENFPRSEALISQESMEIFCQAVADAGIENTWIEQDDAIFTMGEPLASHRYFREVFRQSKVHSFKSLPAVPAGRIFGYAEKASQLDLITERMSACSDFTLRSFAPYQGSGLRFNCSSAFANKGCAVLKAAELLGIDRKNTIAFGDEMNDREMILSVGHGFAMANGNAQLRQEVQMKGAKVTRLTCSEGGVARELQDLLN